MNKKLVVRIKQKLRDPMWQSIGVLVTLLTLLSPFLIGRLFFPPSPPSPNRIIFSSETTKDLTDFSEPVSKRMRIIIDGKEARDLRLFIFRLEYKGEQPVRSADFEEPIRGRIPNNRKLVGVQKSINLEGPFRFSSVDGAVTRDKHAPINFQINLLDEHTFEVKPLLMNPGEWLGIEIYTAAAENSSSSAPKDSVEKYREVSSEITWTCHVAGVDCPGSLDLRRDFEYMEFDEPSFLQVSIQHKGWSVYFIVLFTVVNLIALVLLAKSTRIKRSSVRFQLSLFSVAIALSVASGEVAANWLLPFRIFGRVINDGQSLYAHLIFWLDISLLIFLAMVAIWQRNKARVRVRRSNP